MGNMQEEMIDNRPVQAWHWSWYNNYSETDTSLYYDIPVGAFPEEILMILELDDEVWDVDVDTMEVFHRETDVAIGRLVLG
jgi:hypothetical protein